MNNWQTKKLGEIIKLVYGKPLPKAERDSCGKYPVYGANGIKNYSDSFYFDRPSIVVGRKGSAGELNLTEEKFWPLDVTYYVDFDPNKYDLKFIYNLLCTLNLPGLAKGVKPGINRNDVYTIKVKVPTSLTEQKRIVSILDSVFENIEKAKANTEKNLQNAREVFESCLENIFSNPENDWKKCELGEIICLLTDYHANGSYKILKKNVELKKSEDYAWMVRSTDFENNFENDKRYIDEQAYNFLSKSKIFGNEIIISKIGNAGKVYLMPTIKKPCSLAMNLFLLRMNNEKCLNEYIYRFLNTKVGVQQIESRILGTTTKTITKENVKSIKISFPPLSIQRSIVIHINSLSEQTKKLETIYKQKLAALDELKKSILQKAFAGEL